MNTVIRNVNSVLFLWFGAVKRGNSITVIKLGGTWEFLFDLKINQFESSYEIIF